MTRILATTYVTVIDDHQHGESTLVFSPAGNPYVQRWLWRPRLCRAHFDPKFNAKKSHKQKRLTECYQRIFNYPENCAWLFTL